LGEDDVWHVKLRPIRGAKRGKSQDGAVEEEVAMVTVASGLALGKLRLQFTEGV